MPPRPRFLRLAVWLLIAGGPLAAWACNVPVFRYALERWRPDAFTLVVFHSDPLTPEQQGAVDEARRLSVHDEQLCNLEVIVAKVGDFAEPWLAELWEEQGQPAEARLVLKSPWRNRRAATLWSGPFTPAELARVLDSPGRRELTRRLMAGQSVVWVQVASGPPRAEDLTAGLLQEHLPRLEKDIPLPLGIGQPGSELHSPLPLEIKFTAITVDRRDPAEQPFIAMLLADRPELREADEPVVTPVFGCGRALDALAGEDLVGEVLESAALFLCSACSCQVKELNPGHDLLLKADWSRIFHAQAQGRSPQEAEDDPPGAEPALVPIPPAPAAIAAAAVSPVPDSEPAAPQALPVTGAPVSPPPATWHGLAWAGVVVAAVMAGLSGLALAIAGRSAAASSAGDVR